MPDRFGKVGVLLGGTAAEREISLISGRAVLEALLRQDVDARPFDTGERGLRELEDEHFDRVFNILHGRGGEDGCIQGALELLGIPYTGSGVMASALGMDKWRTKLVWKAAELPIPDYEMLDANSDCARVEARLGLPLFVKPAREGSSIGITKVKLPGQLRDAWRDAARHDELVIAEQCIGGGEYTVAILGEAALPVIRIVPATEFYDYDAKYLRDDTRYLIPCGLPETVERDIARESVAAFRVLGGSGWGRVDLLMDEQGRHYFLEVNTLPGMTSHSLVPMAARAAGMDFDTLVVRILEQTL
jgi:D-alanine-D-alanine ligase